MTNKQIATRQTTAAPAITTRELGTLIEVLSNRLEEHHVWPPHYSISSDQVPTVEQRGALEIRKTELEAAFTPADEAEIVKKISVLRQAFPTGRDTDVGTMLKLYVEVLKVFPEWVIGQACRQYLNGEAGDGKFAPTPPEMVKQCSALMTTHRAQLSKINRILNAEVRPVVKITPEETARRSAMLAELTKSFSVPDGKGEPA